MICVLQFDSASAELLGRMADAGRLPSLAALRERGSEVELGTPAVDFAAGSFVTLYSGVELGDHGLFYPFQWSPERGRAVFTSALEAPPAIWERLAGAGLRTLAIDPYESRPPARAEGVFVSGWGFSDRVVLPRWSRPERALRGFERRHGRGPDATETFGRPDPRDLLALRETLLAAPGRVAGLATRLLGEQRFDLCWLTFAASHLAGHHFWSLERLGDAEFAPGDRLRLGTTLEDVYAAVDAAIGRVVEALPDDADVIVTSPVGMERDTSCADLLPEMLERVLAGGPPAAEDDAGGGAIWRLRAAVPTSARRRIASALPRRLALGLTAMLELRGLDRGSTRAFAHPADNQGYIRLNVAGRDRGGIVEPADVQALAAVIEAGLRDFRHRDGRPLVDRIVEARELYPGARSELLPDLVVRWSGPGDEAVSRRYGTVRRHGAGSGRSGNHTPGGAWALLAPGAAELREPPRPARLVDVAATVCELTGAGREGLHGEPLLARAGAAGSHQPQRAAGIPVSAASS